MRIKAVLFSTFFCVAFATNVFAASTLTVAAFPAIDQIVKAAIPAWKKQHPDIDIKIVSREYNDHHNALTMALATSSALPDVVAIEVGFIGRFSEGGTLEDLSKSPYNINQYRNKLAAFSIAQVTMDNGAITAMPTDIGPGTLFYRKDILQNAGVTEADLTKSWESFIDSGKKIKAKTGAYLLAHARDLKDIVIRADLRADEGVYFGKDNKILVDSPRFLKAFQLAKQARDAKLDAKINAWSNEWSEGLKRGSISTQMMGSWLGGHLANWLAPATKGQWRAVNLPEGTFASWGGTFYSIPKQAQNKTAAWEFIKFMSLTKEIQLSAFKSQDAFPALLEAQNDPFINEPIEFLGGQNARSLWRDAAARIKSVTVNKYDYAASEVINSELDKVLDQGKDIKTALNDAKALIARRARR